MKRQKVESEPNSNVLWNVLGVETNHLQVCQKKLGQKNYIRIVPQNITIVVDNTQSIVKILLERRKI